MLSEGIIFSLVFWLGIAVVLAIGWFIFGPYARWRERKLREWDEGEKRR